MRRTSSHATARALCARRAATKVEPRAAGLVVGAEQVSSTHREVGHAFASREATVVARGERRRGRRRSATWTLGLQGACEVVKNNLRCEGHFKIGTLETTQKIDRLVERDRARMDATIVCESCLVRGRRDEYGMMAAVAGWKIWMDPGGVRHARARRPPSPDLML